MKTIRIAIVNDWLTESAQVELERNLARLGEISDFVFNESGDLEVTYNEDELFKSSNYIFNLCFIQIQHAIFTSGKERASQQTAHLFI